MSGRVDFWSRRKAAVAEETRACEESERKARAAEERAALEERPDEEALAELELPDPDGMKPGDDFTAFMAEAVPERLRRRALRQLWRSNPVLANLDNLVDYGEDYTDAALVVENLQTAYQVGKGALKHLEALAEAAERTGDRDMAEGDGDGPAAENTEESPIEEPAKDVATDMPDTWPTAAEPTVARAKPRMRFAFTDAEPGQPA